MSPETNDVRLLRRRRMPHGECSETGGILRAGNAAKRIHGPGETISVSFTGTWKALPKGRPKSRL